MKKILIIEDSSIFASKIKKDLERYGYMTELMASCDDANQFIERDDIDLLLLDLNLGNESKVHGEGILEVLKNKVQFPIIVMTAHDDRLVQIIQYNVFTVLRKPIDPTLLLLNIRNALQLYELSMSNRKYQNTVDFAIITALYEDEFESVKEIFNLDINRNYQLGDKNIYTGTLENYPYKKIIGVYQSETGRTDASNLVTDVIKEFNPRYIFMTGVCGGSEKTSFGDIIVAKFIFTFDKGKIADIGFLREIELVKTNEQTLRIIRENNTKTITDTKIRILNSPMNTNFNNFNINELKASIDPMACSPTVIDKQNYFKEIIASIDRKASAVEMESYGFARAVESTNSGRTKGVVIKAVMDNTVNKNDEAKSYASYTSAMYLKSLLELGVID